MTGEQDKKCKMVTQKKHKKRKKVQKLSFDISLHPAAKRAMICIALGENIMEVIIYAEPYAAK